MDAGILKELLINGKIKKNIASGNYMLFYNLNINFLHISKHI